MQLKLCKISKMHCSQKVTGLKMTSANTTYLKKRLEELKAKITTNNEKVDQALELSVPLTILQYLKTTSMQHQNQL